MKQKIMGISEFKSHCLEVVQEVHASGKIVTLTKRNQPVAQVVPIATTKESLFNIFQNEIKITGDIVHSTGEVWDAEQD